MRLRLTAVALLAIVSSIIPALTAQASTTVLPCGTTSMAGLTVNGGDVVEFPASCSATLESSGSIVVYGTLRLRPADPSVVHTLRFTGVNEASYVGGGDGVTPGDVGLWVQGAGVLDAQGTPRAGWNRTGADPSWLPGDEVRVTPTAVGDYTTFATFTPGSPVPTVTSPSGKVYAAEVFNLTRNVRIEGTPTGKAHIRISTTVPQTIKHVAIRWMGPQNPANNSKPYAGRSALHLHRMDDASRGSLIEGVVVRDSHGERGIDLHRSHGVTVRDSIVFGGGNEGFGWKSIPQSSEDEPTDDTLIEHSLAANIAPAYTSHRHAGFELSKGTGNVIRDSAAAGIRAGSDASGFLWPEGADNGAWDTTDLVSHNNRRDGAFVWQNNTNQANDLVRMVAYRNGDTGLNHGAYSNAYRYVDADSFSNAVTDLMLHAKSSQVAGVRPLRFDGGYLGDVRLPQHNKAEPTQRSIIQGATVASLTFAESALKNPGTYDLIDTGLQRSDVTINSIHPDTWVRVRNGTDCWQVTASGISDITCWG